MFPCGPIPQMVSHQDENSECQSHWLPSHASILKKLKSILCHQYFILYQRILQPYKAKQTMTTRSNSFLSKNIITHQNTKDMDKGKYTPFALTVSSDHMSCLPVSSFKGYSYALTQVTKNMKASLGAQTFTLCVSFNLEE